MKKNSFSSFFFLSFFCVERNSWGIDEKKTLKVESSSLLSMASNPIILFWLIFGSRVQIYEIRFWPLPRSSPLFFCSLLATSFFLFVSLLIKSVKIDASGRSAPLGNLVHLEIFGDGGKALNSHRFCSFVLLEDRGQLIRKKRREKGR